MSLRTRTTLANITEATERSHAFHTLLTIENGCQKRPRLHENHLVLVLRHCRGEYLRTTLRSSLPLRHARTPYAPVQLVNG